MNESLALPDRIRLKYAGLTTSQKLIGRYCLANPDNFSSLTALRIAEELGVSESTVVRFAVKLGYRGFPEMQAAIRFAAAGLVPTERSSEPGRKPSRLVSSMNTDAEALQQSIAETDPSDVERAVSALSGAKTVHVCGYRTSFVLAYHAAFHAAKVCHSVRLVGGLGGSEMDDREAIRPGDALLAFTFPVYDARTLDTINHAMSVGDVEVVAVTDSALAPIPINENLLPFYVRHDSDSFFNSPVAAISLVNAFLVGLEQVQIKANPRFRQHLESGFHIRRSTSN